MMHLMKCMFYGDGATVDRLVMVETEWLNND